MVQLRLRERFGRVAVFAFSSMFLFILAETVNQNREAWLGVKPGYAPHNFSFNLMYYGPAMLVSTGLAITSVVYYIISMNSMRKNRLRPKALEWMAILPITPIVIFDAWVIVFAVQLATLG
jgi:hypothetical protein